MMAVCIADSSRACFSDLAIEFLAAAWFVVQEGGECATRKLVGLWS